MLAGRARVGEPGLLPVLELVRLILALASRVDPVQLRFPVLEDKAAGIEEDIDGGARRHVHFDIELPAAIEAD